MDLISLHYFSELARDLHFTRTARRLFISQQTLSNHIRRLEEDFGTPLLNRKPSLSLTAAGEAVLKFSEAVGRQQAELEDLLSDISRQERGVLRFGASTRRLNTCLPEVLPLFSARYPRVEVRITDTVTSRLEPLVLDGTLDCAITLNGTEDPRLLSRALMEDRVYLCVAEELLRRFYGEKTEALKEKGIRGAEVKDFAALPYCLFDNRMGRQIAQCFANARVTPRTYMTSTYTEIGSAVCFQRLAACFLSQSSLLRQEGTIPADLNVFPLYDQGQPLIQRLSLIRRKDRYLPQYTKFFLDTLFDFYAGAEQKHVERRV